MAVIAGLTRNPVATQHWIPDVETPDLIRGRDDNYQVRDDRDGVRDDKTKGRGHSRTRDIRGVTHHGALGHR